MNISWDTIAEIPPAIGWEIQYGLAGVLAGSIGGKIVIAGGSNFADKLPWLGGTKLFYDDIFPLIETLSNHQGFSEEILYFNSHSGKLELIGEIPGLTQVTTCTFWWENKVIFPGGKSVPVWVVCRSRGFNQS